MSQYHSMVYSQVNQLRDLNTDYNIIQLQGIALPMFVGTVFFRYMFQGYWPTSLQPQNYLYRKGYYGQQQSYNMNPDNHFDSNNGCWTTDPMCGVDVGPKRPWEDLKNPEKNLLKFQRETTQDLRRSASGYRGF
eukprot:403355128